MRRYTHIVLALLLVAVLASGTFSPARAKSSISFYFYGDPAEEAAYKSLIEAFNKKYPDIEVKSNVTPGEDEFRFGDSEDAYKKVLTTAFTGQLPPDVFMVPYREYPIFGNRGALEPVGPYLDKSKVLKAADFYPEALKPFTVDKTLQCIPQNISGTVVYYNKALFDKAKLTYPKAGWTWDELVKDAKALTDTKDPKNAVYGLVTNVDFTRLVSLVWQNGGEIVDDYAKPTKLTLDTPAFEDALKLFVSFRQTEGITPDETAARAQSNEARFLTGNAGMMLFSRRITPTLRTAKFDWDVAPLPQGKSAASLQYSDGFCISKASKAKDDAWTFIEFANSVDGQTILAKTGRNVPSLKSVAESPAFLDPNALPKSSKVFLDIIPTLRTLPLAERWEDAQEAINEQLEQAYYDGKKLDDAIEEMVGEGTDNLNQK